MNVASVADSSVLLEVRGELTVPNVDSKEKLAEMLASGTHVLDLSGTELRMSDDVKREVFEALGLKNMGVDELKSRIILKGTVTSAPPGSHELVRNFMRKGTREQHFAVVRELARRRREELEKAVRKPMPQPLRKGSSKTPCSVEAPPAEAERTQAPEPASDRVAVDFKTKATTETAAAPRRKKDKLPTQHHDELSTFRSATTASDLASARFVADI